MNGIDSPFEYFSHQVNAAQAALFLAAVTRLCHQGELDGSRGQRLLLGQYDASIREQIQAITADALDRLTVEIHVYARGPQMGVK